MEKFEVFVNAFVRVEIEADSKQEAIKLMLDSLETGDFEITDISVSEAVESDQ